MSRRIVVHSRAVRTVSLLTLMFGIISLGTGGCVRNPREIYADREASELGQRRSGKDWLDNEGARNAWAAKSKQKQNLAANTKGTARVGDVDSKSSFDESSRTVGDRKSGKPAKSNYDTDPFLNEEENQARKIRVTSAERDYDQPEDRTAAAGPNKAPRTAKSRTLRQTGDVDDVEQNAAPSRQYANGSPQSVPAGKMNPRLRKVQERLEAQRRLEQPEEPVAKTNRSVPAQSASAKSTTVKSTRPDRDPFESRPGYVAADDTDENDAKPVTVSKKKSPKPDGTRTTKLPRIDTERTGADNSEEVIAFSVKDNAIEMKEAAAATLAEKPPVEFLPSPEKRGAKAQRPAVAKTELKSEPKPEPKQEVAAAEPRVTETPAKQTRPTYQGPLIRPARVEKDPASDNLQIARTSAHQGQRDVASSQAVGTGSLPNAAGSVPTNDPARTAVLDAAPQPTAAPNLNPVVLSAVIEAEEPATPEEPAKPAEAAPAPPPEQVPLIAAVPAAPMLQVPNAANEAPRAVPQPITLSPIETPRSESVSEKAPLSWVSLTGFLIGVCGLAGLGLWTLLERRHYQARRVAA